jgi:hypothetical protein
MIGVRSPLADTRAAGGGIRGAGLAVGWFPNEKSTVKMALAVGSPSAALYAGRIASTSRCPERVRKILMLASGRNRSISRLVMGG